MRIYTCMCIYVNSSTFSRMVITQSSNLFRRWANFLAFMGVGEEPLKGRNQMEDQVVLLSMPLCQTLNK